MSPPSRARRGSVGLLVVSSLIFSTGGLVVRSLHNDDAWTIVLWRSLSACVFIGAGMFVRGGTGAFRSITRMGRPVLAVGCLVATSSIALMAAFTRASVAVVLVIASLTPLVAALMSRLLLAEPLRARTWVAIAVTVGGVVFMVSGSSAHASAAGIGLAMCMPLAHGTSIVVVRRHPGVGMMPAMFLACAIGTVVALPLARPWPVDTHDLVILLLFGSCQLGLGLALFARGARGTPATETALIGMLEPVGGPLWVWLWRDEYPGGTTIAGGSIVLAVLVVHTLLAARDERGGTEGPRVETLPGISA